MRNLAFFSSKVGGNLSNNFNDNNPNNFKMFLTNKGDSFTFMNHIVPTKYSVK